MPTRETHGAADKKTLPADALLKREVSWNIKTADVLSHTSLFRLVSDENRALASPAR